MDHTFQYSKTIPVAAHFDVVICGGGPAGIGAAVAAAEKGAKTALIERGTFICFQHGNRSLRFYSQ